MDQVYFKTPKDPRYQEKVVKRKKFRFTTNRPWTGQFWQQNQPGQLREKVFVEPIRDWSFFEGDRVEILVGRDKGKQGIINSIVAERNWVFVAGLNTHIRFIGKKDGFPGVAVKSEAPLLVTSDIKLVDPSDLLATDIEWRYTEEGEKVRVSTRTGRIIPTPVAHSATHDYKKQNIYVERPKDTPGDVVKEITFEPTLETFEMQVLKKLGISDDREPPKTYWY